MDYCESPLAPVFSRPVARHNRGAGFVAAHDNLEEVFSGVLGLLFQAHVVDDEQVGFEVLTQGFVALLKGFFGEEVGIKSKMDRRRCARKSRRRPGLFRGRWPGRAFYAEGVILERVHDSGRIWPPRF